MEEYLPFLIMLVIAGYRFYANFQKEQEKARKRNPGKRTPETQPAAKETWERKIEPHAQTSQNHKPELVEEVFDPAYPYEPKYRPIYKEPMQAPSVKEEKYSYATAESAKQAELYNPEVPAPEVLRNRKIHKTHPHGFVPHVEEEETHYDFDMRDAVIKQAILNRPQY